MLRRQEDPMKPLLSVFVTAAVAFTAASAAARPICLDSHRIDHTKVPDSRHIVFYMQDGSQWSNELKASCPGLKFNGFIYHPFADREVCENMQTIRVIQDRSVCMLGGFTNLAPARHT
jgi:hypothetical protein